MIYIYATIWIISMLYQLPNGKVIYLSVEQYLDLTDLDIQYMMSIDFGDHIVNPFTDSAIIKNKKERYYDFDHISDDEVLNNIASDEEPFDDIIDLSDLSDI